VSVSHNNKRLLVYFLTKYFKLYGTFYLMD
jgi:hypothetical protein